MISGCQILSKAGEADCVLESCRNNVKEIDRRSESCTIYQELKRCFLVSRFTVVYDRSGE